MQAVQNERLENIRDERIAFLIVYKVESSVQNCAIALRILRQNCAFISWCCFLNWCIILMTGKEVIFMQRTRLEFLIEYLKQKNCLTEPESDIVKTWDTFNSWPFDVNAAEQKIFSNNAKYPDMYWSIMVTEAFTPRPYFLSTKDFLKNYLYKQLLWMALKVSYDAIVNGRLFA